MKKVATFIRVSNHKNAKSGLFMQKERLAEYCKANGYDIADSATVVCDRKMASPMLMKLLKSAKEKDCEKLVMMSTNRVVGTADDLEELAKVFNESGVSLETLDGSHLMVSF